MTPEVSPSIRRFAERLHTEIFYMRHSDALGPVEDQMPKDRLRPILAAKIKAAGVALTEAQLDGLVHHFPIIDVMPDDSHPNEAEINEREVGALTKLLAHFVPDLADLPVP